MNVLVLNNSKIQVKKYKSIEGASWEEVMSTTEIIQICITTFGGIALLLYGMHILGAGLEKISGGKMEKILEKLTNNIFKAWNRHGIPYTDIPCSILSYNWNIDYYDY